MIKERRFNIGNFCKLTAGGLQVAEFVDIRDALITRYKEVYGTDIDLSTASADGVFVNDLAIIINNILQVMNSMYSNLDVNTASGVYLDALCRLANVTRKQPTHSIASLIVKSLHTSGDPVVFGDINENSETINRITFVDKSGNEWVANASITLGPQEEAELTVTAVDAGPVAAPAGWIAQTLLVMNLGVSQPNNAILGENEETDQELRKRRSQSSGADGTSVLESLVGALLEITGIDDVRIYNNNTLTQLPANDGTVIPAHGIYVILRQQDGLNIDDSVIGELIMNKLTPGIKTVESAAEETNGVRKSYSYIPQMLGVAVSFFEQLIYWKRAVGIHPTITAVLTPTQYFTESEFDEIFDNVQQYASNILIGTPIDAGELFMTIYEADPTFKGQKTYSISPNNVTIANTFVDSAGNQLNPDTYYKYTQKSFVKNANGTYTLTIS